MDVFEKHQLKIAKATLKMDPVMARILGGMTIEQAEEVVARLGKKS